MFLFLFWKKYTALSNLRLGPGYTEKNVKFPVQFKMILSKYISVLYNASYKR